MFLLAEAICFGVTYNKIKEKAKKMKKRCKRHVHIKSAVMNTQKKRKQIKQLVIKNLSKRNNRKNEHMKKKI
jgi:hypothetical protein